MKLTVNGLLGIEHADIELAQGKIVEVIGPNAAGKTSLAVCAQALLAREANPLGLPAAGSAQHYLRDGDGDGTASLAYESTLHIDGQGDRACELVSVEWVPRASSIRGDGADPVATREAVGLVDFTARVAAKARAEMFQGCLLPPPAEVAEAVRDRLARWLDEETLEGVLKHLDQRGWDATEQLYVLRGREAKQGWQARTGEGYGVKKGADWRPNGWLAEFDDMTVQQAEEAVVAARDALAVLHRVQAVSEHEAKAALEAAVQIPAAQKHLEDADRRHAKLVTKTDLAHKKLEAANELAQRQKTLAIAARDQLADPVWLVCPHCDGKVEVGEDGRLAAVEADDADTKTADLEKKLEELVQGQTRMERDRDAAHAAYMEAAGPSDQAGEEVHRARADLQRLHQAAGKGGEVTGAEHRVALAEAEQHVEDAKQVVGLVTAQTEAAKLHATIGLYTEIVRALGPQGVRAAMLSAGLDKLNAGLSVLAQEADWPRVCVADTGAVTVAGRSVDLCSESERWRAQACLQLTLAAITGSKAVVLDRADILDPARQQG